MGGIDHGQRANQREAGRNLDVEFGEAGARRLAELEGHNRAGDAVVQRALDDVDRDGWIHPVDHHDVEAGTTRDALESV